MRSIAEDGNASIVLEIVPEYQRLFPSTVVLKTLLFRSCNDFNDNFPTEHVVSPEV
jgi:hypothetical protein